VVAKRHGFFDVRPICHAFTVMWDYLCRARGIGSSPFGYCEGMTVHEAYEILGLRPLGEFLRESSYRSGSTTWLLVEATLHVLAGKKAVLVGGTMVETERMVKECLVCIRKLSPQPLAPHQPQSQKRVYSIGDTGRLFWESEGTLPRFFLGLHKEDFQVFKNADYRTLVKNRQTGPFSEIRRIVCQTDGSYRAFDGRGAFLMELTPDGANDLIGSDPSWITTM